MPHGSTISKDAPPSTWCLSPRGPHSRAQRLRATWATPLQRSFSQQATSRTSRLNAGLDRFEICCIAWEASWQEGAQPLACIVPVSPVGEKRKCWMWDAPQFPLTSGVVPHRPLPRAAGRPIPLLGGPSRPTKPPQPLEASPSGG